MNEQLPPVPKFQQGRGSEFGHFLMDAGLLAAPTGYAADYANVLRSRMTPGGSLGVKAEDILSRVRDRLGGRLAPGQRRPEMGSLWPTISELAKRRHRIGRIGLMTSAIGLPISLLGESADRSRHAEELAAYQAQVRSLLDKSRLPASVAAPAPVAAATPPPQQPAKNLRAGLQADTVNAGKEGILAAMRRAWAGVRGLPVGT